MSIKSNEPLNLQYYTAAARASRVLGRLAKANASNNYAAAERALYELHDLVEVGLRVVQQHTRIEDAPEEVLPTTTRGVWNPMDGVRVLPGIEFIENGEYYYCNTHYEQFQKHDLLIAWNGRWYRLAGQQR
jgi:hypothetical protein